METGKDLKNWRRKNHLTQEEFAKKSGYSVSRISHIESQNEPLSRKMKDAIYTIHSLLHPKDDAVIEAWRTLLTYGYIPVKEKVDSLATLLPDLLSPKGVGDIDVQTAYMEFLTRVAKDIIKIKDGEPYTTKDSFKEKFMPVVDDIYKAAAKYLKAKSQS